LLVKASTLRRPSGFYRVLAISDVTALVQAHAQAALLARQWDALNAALTIADARQPDCPITYVSPKFEQMTGYSAAECVGRNCRFLQGNQGPAQPEVAQMREAIARKQPVQVVMRNYRKDGGMYWVEISISPVHDAQGDVTHFVAIQQPLNAAPARH
jgi:PAS domain S-box-containing protein